MGRKRVYRKVRIDNIISKIALWELTGRDDYAYGLRLFFIGLDEDEIEKRKAEYAGANSELDYTPQPLPETQPTAVQRQRKTGVFREVRTIRNRSGRGGTTYQWAYDVTYEDGRRVGSKSIGLVGDSSKR